MARRGLRLRLLTAFAMAAVLIIAAGPAGAQKKGGVLRVGNLGEPPDARRALDDRQHHRDADQPHLRGALQPRRASNKPIPMLAEGVPTGQPGRPRSTPSSSARAIKFHNGKEMTVGRRGRLAHALGQAVRLRQGAVRPGGGLRAPDKYTVELKLKEKSAIVLISLAVPNNFGAIYPKEIAEKFPPEQKVTEFIGTGPFKLVEWKPDQYIRMVRFDDYKPRSEKPNGYGGGKIAYVDEIRWMPGAGRGDPRRPGGDGRARLRRRPERSTRTTGSRRTPTPAPSSRSRTTGSSRSSTRRKA